MSRKNLVLLGVSVAILLGVVFFLYEKTMQSNRANKEDVNQTINIPNEGASEKEVAEEKTYPQHIEVITGSDEVWYAIPELGIRMRLNRDLAEKLIYSSDMSIDSGEKASGIYLSTKAITEVAPECAPERGGALGSIFKVMGNLAEEAKNDEYIASRMNRYYFQLDSYYYGWAQPQAVCWYPQNEEAVKNATAGQFISNEGRNITSSIKTIQLIPSK
jgi:hypothetical protein